MKTHSVQQGSAEWLQLRATTFTASEAPAMMGCHPTKKRNELLAEKFTGLTKEVSDYVQEKVFDPGHAAEAQFRPVAERIIGQDLYPVTGSIELDGMTLLASFDGLTVDDSIGFEHKLFNISVADAIDQFGEPPIYHCWQMEQQLLVSGANEILFATSDGTEENFVICRYTSKPERRAALIAGWKQFAADLASYVPSTVTEAKPTGRAPNTLPALHITVKGEVQLSNIDEFREVALGAIRSVNRDLTTDQDFADAEQSVKWCEEVESRLKAAKEHALSQTASIDALFKTIDDISAEARKVRLELDKLVKARKEELRGGIVTGAMRELTQHIGKLLHRVGVNTGINATADFAGAVKGKRSLASIQDAVDTELARAKIAASAQADLMEANIKTLRGEAHDWGFLFPDLATVASKPTEDFANLLAARIAQHKQVEEARRERAEQRQAREAEAAAQAAQVVEKAAAVPQVQKDIEQYVAPGGGHHPAISTIKLGDINARLAPIQISADGLASLGFEPVSTERNAKHYRESDLRQICLAISNHMLEMADELPA